MNFYSIRLTSVLGKTFDFPLSKSIATSKYVVSNIEGLGAPDLDVNIADTAYEGGIFQNSRAHTRRIVMTIGLQPNYQQGMLAGDIRQELYELLDNREGATISVQLRDAANLSVVLQTTGYCTGIVPNIFSSKPEVQLTIECPSPYWLSPNEITINPATYKPMIINNVGNADAGFYFKGTVTSATTMFTMFRKTTLGDLWPFNFRILYSFQANDIIEYNSNYGSRTITVTRSSVTTNLMRYMETATPSTRSKFIMLYPGSNTFRFENEVTIGLTGIVVKYTPRFIGV